MNIRNKKWLLFAGYNPKKEHIGPFLSHVGKSLGYQIGKFNPDWRFQLPNGRRCHERIL